jgi:hypothetical protein
MEGGLLFIRFLNEVPKVFFIYTPALKIAVLGVLNQDSTIEELNGISISSLFHSTKLHPVRA